MFRKSTLSLLAVTVVTVTAAWSTDATAGCHSGYGYGYRYSYPTAYVRPVVQQAPPVMFAELPQEQLASVPVGSTITLPANFLGPHPGSVFLVFNNIKLPVQVLNWADEGVTITLPAMALRQPLKVRIDVVLPQGQLGLQQYIIVTPPAGVILHPVSPTSPLPTNNALIGAGILQSE